MLVSLYFNVISDILNNSLVFLLFINAGMSPVTRER